MLDRLRPDYDQLRWKPGMPLFPTAGRQIRDLWIAIRWKDPDQVA
jgi:hypothetical protein